MWPESRREKEQYDAWATRGPPDPTIECPVCGNTMDPDSDAPCAHCGTEIVWED